MAELRVEVMSRSPIPQSLLVPQSPIPHPELLSLSFDMLGTARAVASERAFHTRLLQVSYARENEYEYKWGQ